MQGFDAPCSPLLLCNKLRCQQEFESMHRRRALQSSEHVWLSLTLCFYDQTETILEVRLEFINSFFANKANFVIVYLLTYQANHLSVLIKVRYNCVAKVFLSKSGSSSYQANHFNVFFCVKVWQFVDMMRVNIHWIKETFLEFWIG